MFRRTIWILGTVTFFLFRVAPCHATAPTQKKERADKVLIVSNKTCCERPVWLATQNAVIEELESIGLQVQRLQWTPFDRQTDGGGLSPQILNTTLMQVGSQNDAAVVIYLASSTQEAYWAHITAVQPGADVEFEELHFLDDDQPDAVQTAALQIVEIVAVLLSATASVPEKQKPVPPLTPKKRTTTKNRNRIGLGFGIASAYSPGGVPPALGIDADIRFGIVSHFSIELGASWAFLSKGISKGTDTATFDMRALRGTLFWDIIPNGRFHPSLGAFGGALMARSKGRSDVDAGIANFEEQRNVATFGLAERLALDVSPHTTFVLNVRGGFLEPHVEIVLNGKPAATYGLPLLELIAGFAFRFL